MSKAVKKALFVFGTRPEAIKMAPVIEEARRRSAGIDAVVCVTAQHRYLLDQAMAEFGIKPDIDLDLMRPDQALQELTSSVICGMKSVYRRVRPDIVFVQGDTSTVFAASLSAYYEGIDVAHIEAGLRSEDNYNPFPEEINRRFVSLVARYNFCPTLHAKQNLLSESVSAEKIFVTGNTVIDALKNMLDKIKRCAPVVDGVEPQFLRRPYVLITGHRRESFGRGLEDVCRTVRSLAARRRDINWLWAAHLNPNVRKVVYRVLSGLENVKVTEPPPYSAFVYLMDRCKFIVSDSGGVQEEAPSLQKYVLVTRACTERPEAVKAGTSILVGTNPRRINRFAEILLARDSAVKKANNPFGDGNASKRIIDVITKGRCREFRI